ncbi:MAG: hypothetical protein RL456_326 [Pseudomonadota bacterium]|jgi:membrane-associated PAP2 superfamily phosphatase
MSRPDPAPLPAARQAVWRRDLCVVLVTLALLLAWDASGLDLPAMRLWGDAHGFAWRDALLTSRVMHDGGRLLGWAVLLALVANLRWPWIGGLDAPTRTRWVVMTLACLLAVPSIKRVSATSCPWDLAEFGGLARHVSHWRLGLPDGGSGHCFPSGHATAAFAFLSGHFALRHRRPRLARAWLAGVLVAGLAFGAAQMVRGAHYPSHTLWSAWLCLAICAALDAWARRGAAARGHGRAQADPA